MAGMCPNNRESREICDSCSPRGFTLPSNEFVIAILAIVTVSESVAHTTPEGIIDVLAMVLCYGRV